MKTRIASMSITLALLFTSIAMGAPAHEGTPANRGTVLTKADPKGGMVKTAICADGKEYWSITGEHRGACSAHGGVASWSDGSPVKSHTKKTAYK